MSSPRRAASRLRPSIDPRLLDVVVRARLQGAGPDAVEHDFEARLREGGASVRVAVGRATLAPRVVVDADGLHGGEVLPPALRRALDEHRGRLLEEREVEGLLVVDRLTVAPTHLGRGVAGHVLRRLLDHWEGLGRASHLVVDVVGVGPADATVPGVGGAHSWFEELGYARLAEGFVVHAFGSS